MAIENNDKYTTPEGFTLNPYPEKTSEVTLRIPAETMKALEHVADSRNLPVTALLQMFISQGLRSELAEKFPELQRELFERRFNNRKQNINAEIDRAA